MLCWRKGDKRVRDCGEMTRSWLIAFFALLAFARPAVAGPPYVSDDPEPTDYKHWEIYTFSSGTATRDGRHLMVVLLASPRIFDEAAALLDYGFAGSS